MNVDAQGVMRMREVDGIALAPKAKVQMKPGAGLHLMLMGLEAPLKEDATFPMTLEFERAGKVEVKVIVGQPKPAGAAAAGHALRAATGRAAALGMTGAARGDPSLRSG